MMKLLAILSFAWCLLANAANQYTAITVVLHPESKLQEKARLLNEEIVKKNPESFRFDVTHFPHLTLVQMIIKNEDLTYSKS